MLTEQEIAELISGIKKINQLENSKDEIILKHLLQLVRAVSFRAKLLKEKAQRGEYVR